MRFLKNKVLKAREAYERRIHSNQDSKSQSPTSVKTVTEDRHKKSVTFATIQDDRSRRLRSSTTEQRHQKKLILRSGNSTKNMSINYGKTISSFSTSQLAIPYLEPYLKSCEVVLHDFVSFVNQAKGNIGGISSLRSLLVIDEKSDAKQIVIFKRIFKMIAEVFIKYFSVNWITHGRLTHKLVYLKFRAKMLRRIQNPELFTYVRKRELKSNPKL